MKGIDVLVVRLMPFVVFAIFIVFLIRAWLGYDYYPFNLLHSNSAIYALGFFLISLANKRYHCVYNRAMYLFLIVFPLFNYLDSLFIIFKDVILYLWVVTIASIFTAIITAYFAVKHFMDIRIRRANNGKQPRTKI